MLLDIQQINRSSCRESTRSRRTKIPRLSNFMSCTRCGCFVLLCIVINVLEATWARFRPSLRRASRTGGTEYPRLMLCNRKFSPQRLEKSLIGVRTLHNSFPLILLPLARRPNVMPATTICWSHACPRVLSDALSYMSPRGGRVKTRLKCLRSFGLAGNQNQATTPVDNRSLTLSLDFATEWEARSCPACHLGSSLTGCVASKGTISDGVSGPQHVHDE